MFTIKDKNTRGWMDIGWLKSRHSFSFGDYYDPENMGFGVLRVINEDWVEPAAGFDTHGHKNMEIITYILEGELAHKDSTGGAGSIHPNEVQVMTAGKGILHSEFNASDTDPVHLLQIWILPDETGTRPGYQQKPFAPEELHNRFRLLVSQDGAAGSLPVKQDAKLHAARFDAGFSQQMAFEKERKYWLQVARGAVVLSHEDATELQKKKLVAGDALSIEEESGTLQITAEGDAEVLLFDLPA